VNGFVIPTKRSNPFSLYLNVLRKNQQIHCHAERFRFYVLLEETRLPTEQTASYRHNVEAFMSRRLPKSKFPSRLPLSVERLEDRVLLAVQGVTPADSSFYGATAAGNSQNPSISSDGQLVAFQSDAGNLVTTDFNGVSDIFVRNNSTGQVTLVSVDQTGQSGNAASFNPRISPDGRFVVFDSTATDLVPNSTNGTQETFVRDLQTNTTSLVSVDQSGSGAANLPSFGEAISADGRLVAFVTNASNVGSLPSGGHEQLYVRDLIAQTTTLVSINLDGTAGGSDDSVFDVVPPTGGIGAIANRVAISHNDRYIAFRSSARDLTNNDFNPPRLANIFLRDLQQNTTTVVDVNPQGDAAGGLGYAPAFSPDDHFVGFISDASDITPNTPGGNQAYIRDLLMNTTTLESVDNIFDNSAPPRAFRRRLQPQRQVPCLRGRTLRHRFRDLRAGLADEHNSARHREPLRHALRGWHIASSGVFARREHGLLYEQRNQSRRRQHEQSLSNICP
jgi:Tol biopolymer transport system component